MISNDICEEFQKFADEHYLHFEFKKERDMSYYEPEYYWLRGSSFSICSGIKYTFRFINPRTNYVREIVINHADLIANESKMTRKIKYAVLDDDQLTDYYTGIPRQMYITTANSHNLQTSVYDKFCEKAGFTQRFEIDESLFYRSPEWNKTRLNAIFGKGKKEKEMKVKIEKVYFNKPYTIVIWSDKTKTMVKAENEAYDEEKGLAMAICKKFLGTNKNGSNYFDEFKKWLPNKKGGPVKEDDDLKWNNKENLPTTEGKTRYSGIKIEGEKIVYLSSAEYAEKSGQSVSTVRRECAQGLHPGAKLVKGRWVIPYAGMARRK